MLETKFSIQESKINEANACPMRLFRSAAILPASFFPYFLLFRVNACLMPFLEDFIPLDIFLPWFAPSPPKISVETTNFQRC